MEIVILPSWQSLIGAEFKKPYFKNLTQFIDSESQQYVIYPPEGDVFSAFNYCEVDEVRVVILGQDPYHGYGQAHGLSFSVNDGVDFPPSLRNIFKEVRNDIGAKIPDTGDLRRWAKQGVLLLNATLTVRAGEAGSHQNQGWEIFTDAVIKNLSKAQKNIVFILWGSYAQRKGRCIDSTQHLILSAPHPSPLSSYRGFFNQKYFSKANNYLSMHNKDIVNW